MRLLLLLLLSAARATAYGYGEDVTSCWATRPGQDTAELEDCQGADVLWGATGPSDNSANPSPNPGPNPNP